MSAEATMVKLLVQFGQVALAPTALFGARTRPLRQYGQTATIDMIHSD